MLKQVVNVVAQRRMLNIYWYQILFKMKKQINEIHRMQKLAGIINEDLVGKPHPSTLSVVGGKYYTLPSTGKKIFSTDLLDDPTAAIDYPELTSEEHMDVVNIIKDLLQQYIERFGEPEPPYKEMFNMAKRYIQRHLDLTK